MISFWVRIVCLRKSRHITRRIIIGSLLLLQFSAPFFMFDSMVVIGVGSAIGISVIMHHVTAKSQWNEIKWNAARQNDQMTVNASTNKPECSDLI